jgi:hypothetical protein
VLVETPMRKRKRRHGRMPYPSLERIARSRVTSTIAVLALCVGLVLSGSVAQGRVTTLPGSNVVSSQSQDTVAKATGGGTVLAAPMYPTTIASFGLNARRAVGFAAGGTATGRINYNRHRNSAGRHINVPVTLMQASSSPRPPNQTGGSATIVGDCTAAGSQCAPGNLSVDVYVEDNADSGAGADVFRIFFCNVVPTLPGPTFDGITPPDGCTGPEGGNLRTGNIQVRGDAGVLGEQMATAAAAGIFPTTPTFNGVDLAGGIYSVGVRTASDSTYGDFHAEFTGISAIGLYQIISVDGWITAGSIAAGTMTFSGTGTLDMGDGPPPVGGLSFSGTLSATGLTLTVGGSSLPALPMTDGYTVME